MPAPPHGFDRLRSSTGSFSVGQTFASYRLIGRIGAGAMGAVWRAVDEAGRQVALKVIKEDVLDEDALARFRREGEALGRLPPHRNVLQVHSAGVERGRPYLVLELVEGDTLKEALSRGPLPIERAAEIGVALARAIAHAHAHGVLHRDLKPANVILRAEDGSPVVMDFGLARLEGAQKLTRTGDVVGTPQYMSPEQALPGTGPVDERTDVHALGAILHEMLTGQPPFLGRGVVEVIGRIVDPRRPTVRSIRPEVDEALEAVVGAALARDIERRLPRAEIVAERLERWLALRRKPARAPRGARAVGAALAIALAVAALGAGAVWFAKSSPVAEPVAAAVVEPAEPRATPAPAAPHAKPRDELPRAIERGDLGAVERLLKDGALDWTARAEIDAALATALARARARKMAPSFLRGLPGALPFERGGAFERAVIAFVLEETKAAFSKGDHDQAMEITIAAGRFGFWIGDARAAAHLSDELFKQSRPPKPETWAEVCVALVRLDVDLDHDHLSMPLLPPRPNGPAEIWVTSLRKIAMKDPVDEDLLGRVVSLLDHDELGPRTQAHVLSIVAHFHPGLGHGERIALLSHAARRLDLVSPVRLHELAAALAFEWRAGRGDAGVAIGCYKEVRERWDRSGSPIILNHDIELVDAELEQLLRDSR